MTEIKEWQQFTQADIRNTNLSNCSKCGELIDFAHIKNNEVVCEDCYFGIPKGEKEKKRQAGLINTTTFVDYVEKEKL